MAEVFAKKVTPCVASGFKGWLKRVTSRNTETAKTSAEASAAVDVQVKKSLHGWKKSTGGQDTKKPHQIIV